MIESLSKAHRPMSVQDMLEVLPEGTDVVTLYRTLNTLVKKRLVRRIRGEDRSWLFESALQGVAEEHVHAHFVCDECGRVECLPDVAAPALPPRSAKLIKGYEVTKQDLTLHGLCPRCH